MVSNLVRLMKRNGAGFNAVQPADQIACDLTLATVTPTGRASASLADILNRPRIFTPDEFGAIDGLPDHTAALVAMASAVQAAGGGIIEFPPNRTFTIWNTVTAAQQAVLFNFTSLSGVTIHMNGSKIVTPANLNGTNGATPIYTYGALFTNCTDVNFDLHLEQTNYNAKSYQGGIAGALFQGACRNVRGRLTMLGGRIGVCINRDSTIAVTAGQRATNFDLDIYTTNNFYPLSCQYNGDNVKAKIFSENAGRSYFIYNCSNHEIDLISSDQANGYDDVLIKCYAMPNGSGGATGLPSNDSVTSNINVKYKKRDSSGDVADDACAEIAFDQNVPTNNGAYYPGRISNVSIAIDVDESGVVQPGSIFKVGRSGFQGVNDTTTVAHVLENITISGTVRGLSGANNYATRLVDFFRYNGGVALDPTGIIARNIKLKDLISKEGLPIPPTIGIDGRCFAGPLILENVITDGPLDLANMPSGKMISSNTQTANFTSADILQASAYTFAQYTSAFVTAMPSDVMLFMTDGREPGQAAGQGTGIFVFKNPAGSLRSVFGGAPTN